MSIVIVIVSEEDALILIILKSTGLISLWSTIHRKIWILIYFINQHSHVVPSLGHFEIRSSFFNEALCISRLVIESNLYEIVAITLNTQGEVLAFRGRTSGWISCCESVRWFICGSLVWPYRKQCKSFIINSCPEPHMVKEVRLTNQLFVREAVSWELSWVLNSESLVCIGSKSSNLVLVLRTLIVQIKIRAAPARV
jgi:hypothetical protein